MKVAIIPADVWEDVRFEEVERVSYDFLTKQVGGMVEALGLPGTEVNFYLNEEGKIIGLPVNARANRLAHLHHAVQMFDIIVGDVVVTGPVDEEGDDTGLTEAQQEWLRRRT